MTQTFWVPGPLPNLSDIIKASKGFKGRGVGYSRLKAKWTAIVEARIKQERIVPARGPVKISYTWHELAMRRDPDNVRAAAKFVNDGLVEAGIIANDNAKYVYGLADDFVWKSATPGVLVTVEEV